MFCKIIFSLQFPQYFGWLTEKQQQEERQLQSIMRFTKAKTVPVDLKELSDILDTEAVINTKFNTLKTKVNKIETKFLMQLLQFT